MSLTPSIGRHIQRGIVDAGREVFEPLEHQCGSFVLQQRAGGRRALEYRAVRRE